MKIIFPKQLLAVLVVATVLSGCGKAKSNSEATPQPSATPKPKVNLIDLKQRPYVTLQPTTARNELEFTIHNQPFGANSVEVVLEYDRNKGILDAVLKQFSIDRIPYTNKLFMGSKSSGGHTTYHDDVIGGTLTLSFTGANTYALEVPWRYDDTQPRYSDFATTDLRFQMVLDQPMRTPKIIVMQSPGLPIPLSGTLLAGPYLIRGVGPLPAVNGKLTIRLTEETPGAKLYGFNGQKWQELPATIDGRVITATVPLIDAYVVAK